MIKREIRNRMLETFAHYGQEFEPFLIQEDDNFFIMDWRDKNGSGNLATRYIVDKKKGTLIITGDSGDCIACWYNEITPENLAVYLNDPVYFIGKIQCSTNKYQWREKDIAADLNEIRDELIRDKEERPDYYDWTAEEIESDFEEIADELDNCCWCGERQPFPESVTDLMQKYYDDPYDSPFSDIGRRIAQRIYLWIVGYQTAIEKLRGKEFVRKDFA